ncbi:MAG: protein kinase domain-containing protein, partial [Fimbriiglobus sp.]
MQTSDSVASFLHLAKQQRLLHPDEVEGLFRDPDTPPENLATVCDRLERRGVLTKFQAELVRSRRWADLNFGGYPVTHEIGPCPGGTAFGALHPSLRTPVVLRRLRPDWLAPADNVSAFTQRAQSASTVAHPNLAHLLDAGVFRDEPFVTLDPFDGADLETLIRDIGPMPAVLATGYARHIAAALTAAHDRGVVHGHVRPACVLAGPLVPMGTKTRPDGSPRLRPTSSAVVQLFELGLTPLRPALAAHDPTAPFAGIGFLPPERAADGTATTAGDVYGLGATLFFLLIGNPPVAAETAGEWLTNLGEMTPARLEQIRPDAPPGLLAAVAAMLATDPAARPTAAAVGDLLLSNPSATTVVVPRIPDAVAAAIPREIPQ